MAKSKASATERFIERVGLAAEAEGLPRIAGRLMAFLLIHDGPFTFADLAGRLRVSRGSVSTNTRLLESLGIIQRITKPGDRHDYYQIADDPYGRLMEGHLRRMRRMAAIVAESRAELDATPGRKRLAEMDRFYRHAIGSTERLLEGWRAERGA